MKTCSFRRALSIACAAIIGAQLPARVRTFSTTVIPNAFRDHVVQHRASGNRPSFANRNDGLAESKFNGKHYSTSGSVLLARRRGLEVGTGGATPTGENCFDC